MTTLIGIDGRKMPEAARLGPMAAIDRAAALGVQGIFFRTVLDMSPTLDPVVLQSLRRHADDLGLYLETGLGKVNPYANPETPELRAIGDGDILLGFRRMMLACAQIDCRELWVSTANFKAQYRGRFAYDRFRTDVDWADQLAATAKFLERLAPIARDLGIHLNLETHEEITSFELVALVEQVGADAVGIVFDTANVLQRMEHPTWAARRIAPYVRQSHMKDASLEHVDGGLHYQLRPCGTGVVDYGTILPVLLAANPSLHLTIENDQSHSDRPSPPAPKLIELFAPEFLAGHPDLSVVEFAAYLEMVQAYQARVALGKVATQDEYANLPYGRAETEEYIRSSAAHLRSCLPD